MAQDMEWAEWAMEWAVQAMEWVVWAMEWAEWAMEWAEWVSLLLKLQWLWDVWVSAVHQPAADKFTIEDAQEEGVTFTVVDLETFILVIVWDQDVQVPAV